MFNLSLVLSNASEDKHTLLHLVIQAIHILLFWGKTVL